MRNWGTYRDLAKAGIGVAGLVDRRFTAPNSKPVR